MRDENYQVGKIAKNRGAIHLKKPVSIKGSLLFSTSFLSFFCGQRNGQLWF
jgi:hypothetical protein